VVCSATGVHTPYKNIITKAGEQIFDSLLYGINVLPDFNFRVTKLFASDHFFFSVKNEYLLVFIHGAVAGVKDNDQCLKTKLLLVFRGFSGNSSG